MAMRQMARASSLRDADELEREAGSWTDGISTEIQPPERLTVTGKSAQEVMTLTGAMMVAPICAATVSACPDAAHRTPANRSPFGAKVDGISGLGAKFYA